MLAFRRFDPSRCGFPAPRAPLLPALRWGDVAFGRDDTTAAELLDGPGARHFSRGRYALHAAYRAAGVGASGALLAPAYHCRTMLDPALALGGAVRFYTLDAQLTPDLESIVSLLAQAPQTSALVVPHYFGFRQPRALMDALAELCLANGVTLVEDCSHGWQIAVEQAPVCRAGTGRMVVASPYKFFASPDGGMLWGNPASLDAAAPSPPGLLAEMKALAATLGHSRACGSVVNAPAGIGAAQNGERGEECEEAGALISNHYDRGREHAGSLALTRVLMRHSRLSLIVGRRRAHYRRWLDTTRGLAGGRALFPELPADCAPYMFPLLIAAPDPHFYRLKQLGVPIWRWDDMAVSDCAVATGYRLRLLHLPCHQSLSEQQMAWMTSCVTGTMAG